MSALCVYALVDRAPPDLGRGIAREPLRTLHVGAIDVAFGEVRAAPQASARTLRAYDSVVRGIARRASAVLPVRFASVVEDESALLELLEPRANELRASLERVRGCEQMTMRVFGEARTRATRGAERGAEAQGAGTRWLVERARAASLPEIEPARAALGSLVRAERCERHDAPPLLASVYHLVPRARAREYQLIIARAQAALGGLHVTLSGPWPPYAFGGEAPP
jgi:hypothetical protein